MKAKRIGKLWYVEEQSIEEYKQENGKQGFGAQKNIEARKARFEPSPITYIFEPPPFFPELKEKVHVEVAPAPSIEPSVPLRSEIKIRREDRQQKPTLRKAEEWRTSQKAKIPSKFFLSL
ncbi:hypothetical protein KW797_04845, partial [Candidatus Parcubacteria bacterium]|nr:hypothetical protein [Candidatus Parcubacteria bacterium]